MTVTDEGNELLQEIVNRVFGDIGFSDPRTRTPGGGFLELKPGQCEYRHWEENDWMFCYTPWKDTEGWYWAWTYKPYGKGSRSGNPTRWKAVGFVKFRSRKKAKKRAEDRYITFTNRAIA